VKPLNVFGELHVTDENGITSVKPTYTCGHCSNVVVMNAFRSAVLMFAVYEVSVREEVLAMKAVPQSALAMHFYNLSLGC